MIPEDLGDKRSSVQTLMNRYGMPNMKIAQHSLGPAEERQEFRVPQNAVICTGVHDNEPVMMWHKNQNRVERQRLNRIFRRLGLAGSTPQKNCAAIVWKVKPPGRFCRCRISGLWMNLPASILRAPAAIPTGSGA